MSRPTPLFPASRHTSLLRGRALAVALLTLAGMPAVAQDALPAELRGLDAYIEAAMPRWQVPGLAVAVVKDDKVVYARGFGVREIGKPGKVDADTVFAIASNSKAFTCTALGMLVDEGKLRWDEKVTDILPWFHLHDSYATADLRVIDLIVHRSGLPTFGGDHLWIGSRKGTREILERIRHQKLTAPFRSSYQYQNIMYTAAGEVLRVRSGKSWSAFVTERILTPLGMKTTSTSVRDLEGDDNVATPHELRGEEHELTTMAFDNVDAVAAAAALNSSVRDVAQWLRFNLAQGRWQGKQMVQPRTMSEITRSHMALQTSPGYARFFGVNFRSYGLGWFLNDYRGRRIHSHGGGLTGMISKTTWVPAERLGVVVLTNMAENSLPGIVTNRILDRYFGAPDRDWNADHLRLRDRRKQSVEAAERALQSKRIQGTSPSLPLQKYTGTYHNPLPGDATVSLKDGKLYFEYNPRHRGFLTHWHHDTFRIHWINNIMDMEAKAFMRFELDEASEVVKLHTKWYHDISFSRKKR